MSVCGRSSGWLLKITSDVECNVEGPQGSRGPSQSGACAFSHGEPGRVCDNALDELHARAHTHLSPHCMVLCNLRVTSFVPKLSLLSRVGRVPLEVPRRNQTHAGVCPGSLNVLYWGAAGFLSSGCLSALFFIIHGIPLGFQSSLPSLIHYSFYV